MKVGGWGGGAGVEGWRWVWRVVFASRLIDRGETVAILMEHCFWFSLVFFFHSFFLFLHIFFFHIFSGSVWSD